MAITNIFQHITYFYFVAILALSVVLNYSWVTYSNTPKHFIYNYEGFYLGLTVISLVILAFMLPKIRQPSPTPQLNACCFGYIFEIHARGELLFVIMACILYFFTCAHCIREFRWFLKAFPGSPHFTLSQVNFVGNMLLLLLQLPLVLYQVGLHTFSVFWTIFFRWGFVHLIVTDICLWVQMAFGEALTLMLDEFVSKSPDLKQNLSYYQATFYSYDPSQDKYLINASFQVPPFESSCQAKAIWLDEEEGDKGSSSLWSILETFLCHSTNTASALRPFFVELCILLAIVVYERRERLMYRRGTRRVPLTPRFGGFDLKPLEAVIGIIAGIILLAFFYEDISDQKDLSGGGGSSHSDSKDIVSNMVFEALLSIVSILLCATIGTFITFWVGIGSINSHAFEMLLLYFTSLGPCLLIFSCAMASNHPFSAIIVVFKVAAYLGEVAVVGLLFQVKKVDRERKLKSWKNWMKILFENSILILAFINVSIWGRLNFIPESAECGVNELREYWGLPYTVMSSIAMPLNKFFRFHLTIMLFQAALENHLGNPRVHKEQDGIDREAEEEEEEERRMIRRDNGRQSTYDTFSNTLSESLENSTLLE